MNYASTDLLSRQVSKLLLFFTLRGRKCFDRVRDSYRSMVWFLQHHCIVCLNARANHVTAETTLVIVVLFRGTAVNSDDTLGHMYL